MHLCHVKANLKFVVCRIRAMHALECFDIMFIRQLIQLRLILEAFEAFIRVRLVYRTMFDNMSGIFYDGFRVLLGAVVAFVYVTTKIIVDVLGDICGECERIHECARAS